eukprot:5802510-Prymnesium_polylepis.1
MSTSWDCDERTIDPLCCKVVSSRPTTEPCAPPASITVTVPSGAMVHDESTSYVFAGFGDRMQAERLLVPTEPGTGTNSH